MAESCSVEAVYVGSIPSQPLALSSTEYSALCSSMRSVDTASSYLGEVVEIGEILVPKLVGISRGGEAWLLTGWNGMWIGMVEG